MTLTASSVWPLPLVLPLLSAVVYVFSALMLKRAADLGADVWRSTRVCNFTIALLFTPLLALGGTIPAPGQLWQPAGVALLFFAGQILNLLALKVGDVSVATPVLGVKVLLVALLTPLVLGQQISAYLWTAAFLSTSAVALLNLNGNHPHHRVGTTTVMALAAALAYALFDMLVQRWSPAWGVGRFLPITMAFVALYSLPLLWAQSAASPTQLKSKRSAWLIGGALCLAIQGGMFIYAIAVYKQAAVANILYSSRGLWSVLAVWLIGGWFTNRERHHGKSVLLWRLLGAALLMTAILLVLTAVPRRDPLNIQQPPLQNH